jgi:hypothetical protein
MHALVLESADVVSGRWVALPVGRGQAPAGGSGEQACRALATPSWLRLGEGRGSAVRALASDSADNASSRGVTPGGLWPWVAGRPGS